MAAYDRHVVGRALLTSLLVLALGCTGGAPAAGPDGGPGPADAAAEDGARDVAAPWDTAEDAAADGTAAADAVAGDAGAHDAAPPGLPFPFTRPDDGTPETPAELQAATDELIALLVDTRYFSFVDERVHGWPATDPQGRYWYGTWWSGVTVEKSGGGVAYRHSADGADNNGLRTAPYLEGACFAWLTWQRAAEAQLFRRLVRGFSSWMLAMVRYDNDPGPPLMTRAAYPVPVDSSEGGRSLHIDYSLDRPGVDSTASAYVHLPTNPTWGDIWIKNLRSKDDIAYMFRALVQVQRCAPTLEAPARADLEQLNQLYAAWAGQVEADGWGIATLDQNAAVYLPSDQLARYTMAGNVECTAPLALHLFAGGATGAPACGNGFPFTEQLAWGMLKNDAKQIQRHGHLAAINVALLRGQYVVAQELLTGLAARLAADLPASGTLPDNSNPVDVVTLLVEAANAGVPLTAREVRWVHAALHQAYDGFRQPALAPLFRVFDPATPDGVYGFDPGAVGMQYADLGVLAGTCQAPYQNPAGQPLVDCDRLRQALLP